jgi:hypothetical protein
VDEYSEELKLKIELDSSQYMIEQLERELILKSALIEHSGFLSQADQIWRL